MYSELLGMDFSREILERSASELRMIPVPPWDGRIWERWIESSAGLAIMEPIGQQ